MTITSGSHCMPVPLNGCRFPIRRTVPTRDDWSLSSKRRIEPTCLHAS
jgi:hypothetical protein